MRIYVMTIPALQDGDGRKTPAPGASAQQVVCVLILEMVKGKGRLVIRLVRLRFIQCRLKFQYPHLIPRPRRSVLLSRRFFVPEEPI